MSDKKEYYEIGQISKNDEVKVYDVIEDLKMGKSSTHKYVTNAKTESDKRNQVDMIDDKEYAEMYEISKNDE